MKDRTQMKALQSSTPHPSITNTTMATKETTPVEHTNLQIPVITVNKKSRSKEDKIEWNPHRRIWKNIDYHSDRKSTKQSRIPWGFWDSNDILYINHHVRQVVYLCHMGTASYLQQTQTRRHKLILQWKNAK